MIKQYVSIILFLAAENNEEAKFIFSKKEVKMPDLESYDWLQKVWIMDETILVTLNAITKRKVKAILNHNYESAANERALERDTIHNAALLDGMQNFKVEAQRDFGVVRCYLLLRVIEKRILHVGFEKKV